jgi:hypothetical protein
MVPHGPVFYARPPPPSHPIAHDRRQRPGLRPCPAKPPTPSSSPNALLRDTHLPVPRRRGSKQRLPARWCRALAAQMELGPGGASQAGATGAVEHAPGVAGGAGPRRRRWCRAPAAWLDLGPGGAGGVGPLRRGWIWASAALSTATSAGRPGDGIDGIMGTSSSLSRAWLEEEDGPFFSFCFRDFLI